MDEDEDTEKDEDNKDEEITPGKDSKLDIGVFTAVATAYLPPNANGISGSESEDAAASANSGGSRGVVVISTARVATLCCRPTPPLPPPLLLRIHPWPVASLSTPYCSY